MYSPTDIPDSRVSKSFPLVKVYFGKLLNSIFGFFAWFMALTTVFSLNLI